MENSLPLGWQENLFKTATQTLEAYSLGQGVMNLSGGVQKLFEGLGRRIFQLKQDQKSDVLRIIIKNL